MFPNLEIVVVNSSDPFYLPKARSLGDRFRLVGFVQDEALRALYLDAAALVWYPSVYEGFGLPVIELMACGTAVVASDASSLPEVAGDAALLISVNNPRAHVDAISSLLTDDRARQHFEQAGRRRAEAFTWGASTSLLRSQLGSLV